MCPNVEVWVIAAFECTNIWTKGACPEAQVRLENSITAMDPVV